MGAFSKYTKEGPGVSKEQANAPLFIQFFRTLGTRFWSLILLNLLYILFCIPIITIGPATAGMTKVLRNWSRRENAFIWGDFWETFRVNFKQAFVVGILETLVWGILIYDCWFFANNAVHYALPRILMLGVVLLSALIWLYMRYYLYTMLITFRLTIPQLFKNAFIFAGAGFLRNTLITLINALLIFVFWIFRANPFIWLVYLCTYAGISNYVITFITYPLIRRFMIDNVDPKTGKRIDSDDTENKSQAS